MFHWVVVALAAGEFGSFFFGLLRTVRVEHDTAHPLDNTSRSTSGLRDRAKASASPNGRDLRTTRLIGGGMSPVIFFFWRFR